MLSLTVRFCDVIVVVVGGGMHVPLAVAVLMGAGLVSRNVHDVLPHLVRYICITRLLD